MSVQNQKFMFKNATVQWAIVGNPDADGLWRVDIYASDAELKELEAMGVPIKENDKEGDPMFGKKFAYAKRKSKSQAGTAISPPTVVDSKRNAFSGLIGNGSVCNVRVSIYDWTYLKKSGKNIWLEAIQVVDLVEYGGDSGFDEVPDGFAAEGSATEDIPF